MILSAHQPAYMPWLGYFEKIQKSDIFIYLDTVQFEKNSYINRNKIKTPQGSQWLTAPIRIKGHTSNTLMDMELDIEQPWAIKHLRAIELNYRKSRFFSHCYPKLENLFSSAESKLTELCWDQLKLWLDEFEIETRIVRLSELNIMSKKSELVLDLCKHFSAETYYSGALGINYLDTHSFAEARIKINYQKYTHPTYPQLWGNFEPFMCIVDYWMNCGPGKLPILKG